MYECANKLKDVAIIEPIPCSFHLHLVHQPPHELAYYCELQQHVAATDFELQGPEFPGGDQGEQIIELLGCEGGRAALLHRASHFAMNEHSDKKPADTRQACQISCNLRERQFDALVTDCMKEFDRAVWLHRDRGIQAGRELKDFLHSLEENNLGDLEVSIKLRDQATLALKEYHAQNWEQIYGVAGAPKGAQSKATALRASVRKLATVGKKLVNYKRALRFSTNIHRIQLVSEDPSQSLPCENCNAPRFLGDLSLLNNCGHLICRRCFGIGDTQCPIIGCSSEYEQHQKLAASGLSGHPSSGGYYPSGKKLHEITNLITKIPSDEKVLLFVQHAKLLAKIECALHAVQIKYASPKSGSSLSNALSQFQAESDDKVFVLNIGDVSAAGR